MDKWQENQKTIPLGEMLYERQLLNNSARTDAETEALFKKLCGETLTTCGLLLQLTRCVEQAAQSNLVTPKTEVLLSYALSEMANHIMNMLDHLKTLTSTWQGWRKTSLSEDMLEGLYECVADVLGEVDRITY